MSPVVTTQYPKPWIQVFGPSGANFVSLSTTLQVPFASVTKVKIESMARVVRKTWKKKKDDESNK